MKSSLIKRALLNSDLLKELPHEVLTPEQSQIIQEANWQQIHLTSGPTLKSITHEVLKKVEDTTRFKAALQEIIKSPDLDKAQAEIELFKLRTEAILYLVKKLQILYEGDQNEKDIELCFQRINELKKEKEEQWENPVNAKQWDKLEQSEVEELKIQIDWLLDHDVPFKKKVLYSIIATTNGGKTVVKTWLSVMFMKAGYNVLYLAQEEPYHDTIRRIHQATLDLTEAQYKEATKEGFEEIGKMFNELSERNGWGNIFVVEWTNIPTHILQQKIRDFQKDQGVVLDAVFVDYGKLLEPSSKTNSEQEWLRIGNIFKELKAICMQENICCVTSIQLNREATKAMLKKNQTPDVADVSGAYEATHHANYIWSVTLRYSSDYDPSKPETPDTERGTFVLTVQKSKYGRLRKGDWKAFKWLANHYLIEANLSINPFNMGLEED